VLLLFCDAWLVVKQQPAYKPEEYARLILLRLIKCQPLGYDFGQF
jgi:hypothetical protein